MSVSLKELIRYLDNYLSVSSIQDYCPNGLQVEGRSKISKVIGGVTASQALIDHAINENADAILVHHGYFWKGEEQTITGIKKKRLQSLLKHDISLIAYHLPLDVHPVVGNNVQLAEQLKLKKLSPLDPSSKLSIGLSAELDKPMSAQHLTALLTKMLGRECMHIGDESKLIHTLGICTGAAQSMITQAVNLELDAFLSGEISEPIVHISNETGVNYFSAGHHATERGGVQALGKLISKEFGVDFKFIDLYNPV